MSSNSRNGFMGWVQKNPGTAFAIFLVFAAIVTIIVMVTRGSAASAGPGAAADGVSIEITSISKKIIPQTENTTEEAYTEYYNIEYETGDIVELYGKNVDFVITWKNGAGFTKNKVNKLIFERMINGKVVQSIDRTDNKSITNFGGGTVEFDGDTLTDADSKIVGTPNTNSFRISYTTVDNATPVEILLSDDIEVPQSDIDAVVNLTSIVTTPIDPTIFKESGFSQKAVVDSFSYVNMKSRMPGFNKNFRVKSNADNSITFTVNNVDSELVPGETKYKIEKYLDFFIIIIVSDGDNNGRYVAWDTATSSFKTFADSAEVFGSSDNLSAATWILETIERKRSAYIDSVMYTCGNAGAVDVTNWFNEFIDKTEPGDDLSKYLCSASGKYDGSCPGGSYPGYNGAFSELGLYNAAKLAGATTGACDSTFHVVVIKGKNGASVNWTWGAYLDLSNILTTAPARSIYIKSASYKCGGYGAVDVTTWFKNYIDRTPPGDDASRYLCSAGGKYSGRCPGGGGYPGYNSAFSDDGLYDAAKAAGDPGGSCGGTFHAVTVTGVNGFSATWKWGAYLDLSNILTTKIARSAYIKSAMYKCGGYRAVDVTSWFKGFVNATTPGDELSKYLCGTNGKYAGKCAMKGSYPGYHSAFSDIGLYEAAKAAGDPGGACGSTYHALTVTGVNDATYTWSWGSYLDLSGIITSANPFTGDDLSAYNRVITIENNMKSL